MRPAGLPVQQTFMGLVRPYRTPPKEMLQTKSISNILRITQRLLTLARLRRPLQPLLPVQQNVRARGLPAAVKGGHLLLCHDRDLLIVKLIPCRRRHHSGRGITHGSRGRLTVLVILLQEPLWRMKCILLHKPDVMSRVCRRTLVSHDSYREHQHVCTKQT